MNVLRQIGRRTRPRSWTRAASSNPIPPTPLPPSSSPPTIDPDFIQETISSINTTSLPHSPNIVFDNVQNALEAFHTFSGLPWYLTIIGSTLLVRASFVPLILYQSTVLGRYATAAKPEGDKLWELTKQATQNATTATKLKAYPIYVNGMFSILNKHGISLFSMFGGSLIQIPIFITFVFTMRRMIRDPELANELSNGGILWFENLTLADPTLLLPLTAIGLTYINLQVSLGNAPNGSMFYYLKDIGQVLLILFLPITSGLPSGVFVYWTTSASFAAIQTQVLRADSFRIAMGLPPIPKSGGNMPTPKD